MCVFSCIFFFDRIKIPRCGVFVTRIHLKAARQKPLPFRPLYRSCSRFPGRSYRAPPERTKQAPHIARHPWILGISRTLGRYQGTQQAPDYTANPRACETRQVQWQLARSCGSVSANRQAPPQQNPWNVFDMTPKKTGCSRFPRHVPGEQANNRSPAEPQVIRQNQGGPGQN